MMKEKMFEAIGGLDEKLLADSENVKNVRYARVLRRGLLVAALVAGLAVTAAAAPRFRNALQGGSMQTDDTAYFTPTNPQTGESHENRRHEITLEVAFEENVPESIETFYMLHSVPEGFAQDHGYVYRDACLASFGWNAGGTGRYIYFSQQAGGTVAAEVLSVSVFTVPDQVPEHGLRTIAGIQGYLIDVPVQKDDNGKREFYWSDGQYLFCLRVPCDFTDAELEQLLSRIQPVEDITPYLYSMTDEEITNVIG